MHNSFSHQIFLIKYLRFLYLIYQFINFTFQKFICKCKKFSLCYLETLEFRFYIGFVVSKNLLKMGPFIQLFEQIVQII
jgi:hypothetical protein